MVTTGKTATLPGDTIQITKDSPVKSGTATSTDTKYAVLLTEPDIGSIYNGVKLMSANFGDSNIAEGDAWQIEIPSVHPQSNTPNDKATAFSTNDALNLVKHVIGSSYWLKGSSLSAAVGAKLVPAGSGLVKVALAHTSTPKAVHTWVVDKLIASKTYVQATYKGLTQIYTTN